jgi:replicative superfamily II helicase
VGAGVRWGARVNRYKLHAGELQKVEPWTPPVASGGGDARVLALAAEAVECRVSALVFCESRAMCERYAQKVAAVLPVGTAEEREVSRSIASPAALRTATTYLDLVSAVRFGGSTH